MSRKKKTEDSTAAVALSGAAALSTVLQGGDLSQLDALFTRRIQLLYTQVNGSGYVENIREHLAALRVGDRVQLLREPANEHDANAIAVRMTDDRRLGYIPRAHNEILANLMDAGKYLYGTVEQINADPDDRDYPWKAVMIKVYMED